MRTEGLQESLQKTPAAEDNADHITKIKRTFKAVSLTLILLFYHQEKIYKFFKLYALPLFEFQADGLEVFANKSTIGLHLCQSSWTGNCFCQH